MTGMPLHTRWDDLKRRVRQTSLARESASCRDQQRKTEIFQQRAALLAARRTQGDAGRGTTPVLVFVLGDQRFGIPLSNAAQVYPVCSLTPVPRTPSWMLGIANLASQIRSVIDIAELLNLPADRPQAAGNILLMRCSAGTVAARVDGVEEVQKVDLDHLVIPDPQSETASANLIRGVTPEHLVILSVESLIEYTALSAGKFS